MQFIHYYIIEFKVEFAVFKEDATSEKDAYQPLYLTTLTEEVNKTIKFSVLPSIETSATYTISVEASNDNISCDMIDYITYLLTGIRTRQSCTLSHIFKKERGNNFLYGHKNYLPD